MVIFNYNKIKLLIVYIKIKLVKIEFLNYNYKVNIREFTKFNFI